MKFLVSIVAVIVVVLASFFAWFMLSGNSSPQAGTDGKVLRAAVTSKIKGLDPASIGDVTSTGIGSNMYEALYDYHYLRRPYELQPNLAAAMPDISDDGLVYTIRLRDDVYFAPDECFGENAPKRQLVADDFIYSWKRLADIKTLSPNWSYLAGLIEGLDDFRAYTQGVGSGESVDYSRPVEGLVALDDFTLKITLTKPAPTFNFILAHLPTAVVAREAVEYYGEEIINHPVGTGPFMVESWQRGSKIVLVRNPHFRELLYPSDGEAGDEAAGLLKSAGKRMPFIDRAEISIIEEDQPYWLQFDNAQSDYAGIPKDNFGQVVSGSNARELSEAYAARKIKLDVYEDPGTFWYGFNMDRPEIANNLPLRQAMNLGFDRKKFLELFLNGRGMPARGILPEMMQPEGVPELNSPYTVYDREAAKAKIQEAKAVAGGTLPKIVFTIGGTDSTMRQMGQFIKRLYTDIGMDFDVEYVDWPTLQEKVNQGDVQAYGMGWIGDYPDGKNFMQLFYGPNRSPGPNGMNYRNERFDELYQKLIVTPVSPERDRLVRELEQIVIDDLPCVLTTHRRVYRLSHPWVLNYKPHVFGYGLMRYYDIDTQQRENAKR